MLDQIKQHLQSVRARQRYNRGLRAATVGLLVSAALGCGLLIAQKFGVPIELSHIWGQLLTITGLSGITGLLFPQRWSSSAHLVDTAYGLKDRTATALEFAQKGLQDEIYLLQQYDALAHLNGLKANQVVPWKTPRLAPICGITFCVMLGLSLFPQRNSSVAAAAPAPLQAVQSVTVLLEETMLEELEKLKEDQEHPELDELTKELQELVEEMKAPEVDQKEALAKLSEMQQLLNDAIKNLDVAAVEAQLNELAAALEPAESMQAASQAMKDGKYRQAAAELEKVDPQNLSRREREAVQSNLANLSKKLGNGKKGVLSNALSEMMEGLENENHSQCKSGLCQAAGVCKSQGLKKSLRECLNCQLNRLAECKGSCQGNCQIPSSKVAKSDSPQNSWGTGASGQPLGQNKTSLDSTRREENVTGIMGEGSSEKETETTLEARQSASRSYQERYQEFKKQMEEVLDSEPLPLGHRATVRRYFEAIRPDTNQAEQLDPNTAP